MHFTQAGRAPRTSTAILCCAVLFLYAVYLGALGVLLPYIGVSFRLGPAAEGRLFPANFLGFILGVLLCGSLSDRLGRKAVLLGGVAAYALGLALFSGSGTFAPALLATALIGAGSGAMETVASALAADLFPERRAFLINALQVAFGAGAMVSPALAHVLLTNGTPWQTLYLSLAVANVLLFLALAFQPVTDTRHEREALDWDGPAGDSPSACVPPPLSIAGALCRGRGRLYVLDADLF